jgi:hypothetical protein
MCPLGKATAPWYSIIHLCVTLEACSWDLTLPSTDFKERRLSWMLWVGLAQSGEGHKSSLGLSKEERIPPEDAASAMRHHV